MSHVRQATGYAKGRSTKTEILNSAMRVFARKGYRAASLKEILQDVGITKGAFYHHWQSKEDLALELVKLIEEDYNRRAAEYLKDARSAWDRIDGSLELVAELNEDDNRPYRDVWLSLMFYLPERAERLSRQTIRQNMQYLKHWTSLLEEGQAEGSVRTDQPASILAEMLQAFLSGIHLIQRSVKTSHSHKDLMFGLREMLRRRSQ